MFQKHKGNAISFDFHLEEQHREVSRTNCEQTLEVMNQIKSSDAH